MGALRGWHIAVLIAVLILLFGAKKLPDMARSLGRSLRILKAETKNLRDDSADEDLDEKAPAQHSRQSLPPTIDGATTTSEQARPKDGARERAEQRPDA